MFVCLFASLGGGRKQDWEYDQGRLCSHLRLSESLVGCSTSHPLGHTTAQNQAGSHPESLHVSGKTASKRKLNLQEFKARGCLFGCLFWSQAGHLEVWRSVGLLGGNPSPGSLYPFLSIPVCGFVSMLAAAWWPQEGHCALSSTASQQHPGRQPG